jgi:hypothetical protein
VDGVHGQADADQEHLPAKKKKKKSVNSNSE